MSIGNSALLSSKNSTQMIFMHRIYSWVYVYNHCLIPSYITIFKTEDFNKYFLKKLKYIKRDFNSEYKALISYVKLLITLFWTAPCNLIIVSQPGIELASPVLQGKFLIAGLPGKSQNFLDKCKFLCPKHSEENN